MSEQLDLELIKARAAAATPGPWRCRSNRRIENEYGIGMFCAYPSENGEIYFAKSRNFIAHARTGWQGI